MNRRSLLFWLLLAGALLLVGLATGGRRQAGDPLDPDSTDPLGTRALMIFLDEYDTDVVRELPDDATPRALMLADQLTANQRLGLESWVERGGTLVVTDPGSPLVPEVLAPSVETSGSLASGVCTIAALNELELEGSSFILYPTEGSADQCFGDPAAGFVHVSDLGQGQVVALGGALPFTNQNLDEADNAVLAAQLLLGDDEIAVLYEPVLVAGSQTLADLVPSAAKWATWQLLVAFAVFVAWRATRFGRPVLEPQPVQLPGSLLVRATGELHRRSGGHSHAADRLRSHLDRRLRRQLRVSPEVPVSQLVSVATTGNDLDLAVATSALSPIPVANGEQLSALVVDIDRVDAAVLADKP